MTNRHHFRRKRRDRWGVYKESEKLSTVRVAPLTVKTSDWPIRNVTDRTFPFKVTEGDSPLQMFSKNPFTNGHEK